ncbi:hypothetical protein BC937DRAFT_89719 [Endogone sp. FLAS-F59071]|nr:hypothetical protein BC937DRAFT_89719 [Endogone sp. FLAS-F59071]|eukprot:RUS23249.1 hypothetical protein BC937DRAFT_89719 [Endogone sp. FLAS-F59071]
MEYESPSRDRHDPDDDDDDDDDDSPFVAPDSQGVTPEASSPTAILFSTPILERLNDDDLRHRLKDAYQMIKEKDQNLILAAEIGQQLLQSNEGLKGEYEKLLLQQSQASGDSTMEIAAAAAAAAAAATASSNERHDVLSAYASDLEGINADLQRDLDAATHRLREFEHASERQVQGFLQELEAARRDLDHALRRGEELEDEKKRLARERADLARTVAERRNDGEILEQLQARVYELEGTVRETEAKREVTESRCAVLAGEGAVLEKKCAGYQKQIEELRELREENEAQAVEISELERALDEAGECARALEARLAVLEPESAAGSTQEGVTLFSEVEDRRLELEVRNRNLARRHAGLVQAHTASVYQQERMKHHISRLTQLSQDAGNEARMRRLEEALGQSISENRLLQARLVHMQKMQEASLGRGGAEEPGGRYYAPDEKGEVIETLRLRVEQLGVDADALRKELRTSQMLRLSESEKARKMEGLLTEREAEFERLKVANAQIMFELDEERLKAKLRNLEDDKKDGIVTEVGEARTTHGKMVSRVVNTDEPKKPVLSSTGQQTDTVDVMDQQVQTDDVLWSEEDVVSNSIMLESTRVFPQSLKSQLESMGYGDNADDNDEEDGEGEKDDSDNKKFDSGLDQNGEMELNNGSVKSLSSDCSSSSGFVDLDRDVMGNDNLAAIESNSEDESSWTEGNAQQLIHSDILGDLTSHATDRSFISNHTSSLIDSATSCKRAHQDDFEEGEDDESVKDKLSETDILPDSFTAPSPSVRGSPHPKKLRTMSPLVARVNDVRPLRALPLDRVQNQEQNQKKGRGCEAEKGPKQLYVKRQNVRPSECNQQ